MASAVLILTICLSGACHDEPIPLDSISVHGCSLVAQETIAMWISEHPAYTVAKWRCEETGENDI